MTGTIQSLRNQIAALTADHKESVAQYNADNAIFNAAMRRGERRGSWLEYECDLEDDLRTIRQQEARIRELMTALDALTARVAA